MVGGCPSLPREKAMDRRRRELKSDARAGKMGESDSESAKVIGAAGDVR